MNKLIFAAGALALSGCVAYPAYQPAPIARLPADGTTVAPPLTQAERDRLAQQNAQVQREDQADIDAQRRAYTYAYPATPYYYAYPAYGWGYYDGFYPWGWPGLSLSFGYSRYWGGHRGYRGGWRGGGGWHGGGGWRGRR